MVGFRFAAEGEGNLGINVPCGRPPLKLSKLRLRILHLTLSSLPSLSLSSNYSRNPSHVPQTHLPEIYMARYLPTASPSKFMESVASTSSPPGHPGRRRLPRLNPSQAVADRIVRALHHHLRLLHRSDSSFFVLGATSNVYIVSLSSTPSCSCPDRITPCKHILFVYIRALGMSLDDVCLWRRTLRPCQLRCILGAPVMLESLADIGLRRIFHQQFFQAKAKERDSVDVEDGTACPVCLDEMVKKDRLVACTTCRNVVHEDCFLRWKRSKGRRSVNCVICRANWKDLTSEEKYLNLSAYVNEQNIMENNNYG